MLRDVAPVPPLATGRAVVSESEPNDAVVAKRLVVVAVPKYPVPLAVKFVVDAPPFIEKSPLVIVEEELERKPFVKVARPVEVSVELRVNVFAVRAPSAALCEKRFVELAVVEKKLVVVPAVRERLPSVVRPVTFNVEERVVAPAPSVPKFAA